MLGLPGFLGLVALWGVVYALSAWRSRRRGLHRDVAAVGVLALVVIGFFWPLFFTRSWIPKGGGDLVSFIYPVYAFAARWLKRGVIPLWNPHLYLGMPFAADNQSGLFYPINLLFFLLTPTLTYPVVELMAVTHVFLAGLFTYLLVRDLPAANVGPGATPVALGRIPAVAGGITYMLGDLFVIHPGNLNIIATAAWLPLAILCFRRAAVRCSWGWAACSGAVLGMAALVGHAQMFLYVAIAVGLYAAFDAYAHCREGWAAGLRRGGQLVLAGAIALGLAGPSLIPALDLTQYTVRASLSYAQASEYAIPPQGLIGLLLPGFWGRGTGSFWGPWLRTEMGYVGVLPMVLAVVAMALAFRRYPLTRFWLLLGAFGLLVAMGGHTVLHGWLYALLPVFRQLRVPARAIVLWDLCVAMLAAVGLDLLLHPLARRAHRAFAALYRALLWAAGALGLVALPLLGHAVLVSRTVAGDVLAQIADSAGSVVLFLVLLGAAVGGLALRRYRLARPRVLGTMAVCLIAFDLTSLGAYVEIEPNDPLGGYRHDRALAFLRSDSSVFRVETATEVQGSWAPDWALIEELDDLNGIWNPLRLGAYDVLTWVGIRREDPFYNLYNVKYLIAPKEAPVPAHFEAAFDDGKQTIYRNTRALPRVFMVYRAQVVAGDMDALHAAKAAEFDPSAQIVLVQAEGAAALEADPGEGEHRAEIVARGPNHLDVRVVTPVEGYLFVSEMWLPGWVAYVDGVQRPVLKADYTFRAVRIPAGSHEVRMVYRPWSWFVGLGLGLVTLIGLLTWSGCALSRLVRGKHRADGGSASACEMH